MYLYTYIPTVSIPEFVNLFNIFYPIDYMTQSVKSATCWLINSSHIQPITSAIISGVRQSQNSLERQLTIYREPLCNSQSWIYIEISNQIKIFIRANAIIILSSDNNNNIITVRAIT